MTDRPALSRWIRAAEIFDQASAFSPDERPAFLAAACGGDEALLGEVQSLLAFDHGDGAALDAGIRGAVSAVASSVASAAPGIERLGPYVLRDEIGRGGMGAVFLAERADDFSQRVA